jgi:ornithine cyclodeaminase
MLADVATGYPQLISEMTVLTALRTAATSALAARHLANRGAKTMALIGTGAQGEFQALAFKACLGIRTIRYYDIDRGAMLKFARNLTARGIELIACKSIAEAVKGAEIVTTATAIKGSQSVLTDALIDNGIHINAIGGDCPGKTELDPILMARARIFVEYLPQTRIEGDIQRLGSEGQATELWEVIAGRLSGRTSREEITIFDSVGFAIEDYSTLRYVYAPGRRTPRICLATSRGWPPYERSESTTGRHKPSVHANTSVGCSGWRGNFGGASQMDPRCSCNVRRGGC